MTKKIMTIAVSLVATILLTILSGMNAVDSFQMIKDWLSVLYFVLFTASIFVIILIIFFATLVIFVSIEEKEINND